MTTTGEQAMGIKSTLAKVRSGVEGAAGKVTAASTDMTQRVAPVIQRAGQAAMEGATKAVKYATLHTKEFALTTQGKKILGGAAIGGAAGVPLPVLGPITGALIGAAAGWCAGRKDTEISDELDKRCRSLTPMQCLEELETLEALRANQQITEERYLQVRKALSGK
jgi:hypothetical protein